MKLVPYNPDGSGTARITSVELLLLALCLVAAVVLRCAFPDRIAIEHFDEAIYASNVWFDASTGFAYPRQELYAPPLLPLVIETLYLFNRQAIVPFLPGMVSGVLTVAALWWLGRTWFNPRVGLAAAAIAALSDFHSLLSRTALTDVPLGLLFVVAMHAWWGSFTHRGWWRFTWHGLLTGVAWWIKYNGWLPAAISLAGIAGWHLGPALRRDSVSRETRRHMLVGLLGVAVAFAVWLPVLQGLQPHGGYAAVMANHRGYVVCWSGWWSSLDEQLLQQLATEGWTERLLSWGLLLSIGWWHAPTGFTWNENRSPLRRLAALAATCIPPVIALLAAAGLCPFFLVLVFASLCGLSERVLDAQDPRATQSVSRETAVWLLAAWCGAMIVLTPLYVPYLRLLIPLWLSTCVGTAVWLDNRFHVKPTTTGKPAGVRLLCAVLGLCLAVALTSLRPPNEAVPAWRGRQALASVSREIERVVTRRQQPREKASVVYVWGEPAVFFHLRANGQDPTRPVDGLGFLKNHRFDLQFPTYLVVGEHARHGEGFEAEWKTAEPRLRFLQSFYFIPSPLVQLDQPGVPRNESSRLDLYLIQR